MRMMVLMMTVALYSTSAVAWLAIPAGQWKLQGRLVFIKKKPVLLVNFQSNSELQIELLGDTQALKKEWAQSDVEVQVQFLDSPAKSVHQGQLVQFIKRIDPFEKPKVYTSKEDFKTFSNF